MNPKMLLGIAGGLVVVVVVILVLTMGGGNGNEQVSARTSTTAPPTEQNGETKTEPSKEPAKVPDLVAKTPEPEPDPVAAKPKPEPAAPEVLDPVISFASHKAEKFPKTPDSTDEEWDEIEQLVHTVMTDRGRKGTRAGRRLTRNFGFKAIPALINAYDGMDLSDPMTRVNASYISRLLEEIFHQVVKVGFRAGDTEKDLRFNIILINTFIPYWQKKVDDPGEMEKTRQKIAEAAAKEEGLP